MMLVRGRSRAVQLIAAATSAINAQAKAGPFGQHGGERQAAPETACGQARSRGADRCPGLARRSHPVPRRWPESPVRVMTTSDGLNRIRETPEPGRVQGRYACPLRHYLLPGRVRAQIPAFPGREHNA